MISACCWQYSNEHLWMFESKRSIGLAPRAVCLSFCIKAPRADLWSNQSPPAVFLLKKKKKKKCWSLPQMCFRKIVTCIFVLPCNTQESPIKNWPNQIDNLACKHWWVPTWLRVFHTLAVFALFVADRADAHVAAFGVDALLVLLGAHGLRLRALVDIWWKKIF